MYNRFGPPGGGPELSPRSGESLTVPPRSSEFAPKKLDPDTAEVRLLAGQVTVTGGKSISFEPAASSGRHAPTVETLLRQTLKFAEGNMKDPNSSAKLTPQEAASMREFIKQLEGFQATMKSSPQPALATLPLKDTPHLGSALTKLLR